MCLAKLKDLQEASKDVEPFLLQGVEGPSTITRTQTQTLTRQISIPDPEAKLTTLNAEDRRITLPVVSAEYRLRKAAELSPKSDGGMDPELLAAKLEVLHAELSTWLKTAPPWVAARFAEKHFALLGPRVEALKKRITAPLIVGIIGGTGTGKSALTNALVAQELVEVGKQRPTTNQPVLVSPDEWPPEFLGIDPDLVHWRPCRSKVLENLVLIDCPDPDTTDISLLDSSGEPGKTNLDRLRQILPFCDVLIVTATQQKYRSACVSRELAQAAVGARLIFVQTHASQDDDIREDWRKLLEGQYDAGYLYLVDSEKALQEIAAGQSPTGDMAKLVKFLSENSSGTLAIKVRFANYLDLVEQFLASTQQQAAECLPGVQKLEMRLEEWRRLWRTQMAAWLEREILPLKHDLERRVLDSICSRLAMSPLSLLLRHWNALSWLVAGWLMWSSRSLVRTVLLAGAQMLQQLKQFQLERRAQKAFQQLAELNPPLEHISKEAGMILPGYLREAGLAPTTISAAKLEAEHKQAVMNFMTSAMQDLDETIGNSAQSWPVKIARWTGELLLLAAIILVVGRLAKNFFYDSWLATPPQPIFGLSVYLISAGWLAGIALVIIWLFTRSVSRFSHRALKQLAQRWQSGGVTAPLFAHIQEQIDRIRQFCDTLDFWRASIQREHDQIRSQITGLGAAKPRESR